MTTTTQNTVFSPTVKANVEFVVVERCATGKEILHRRAEAVRVATIETWWAAEGKGWLEYIRHELTCEQCQTFEIARRAGRWDLLDKIEAEKTK